MADHSENSTADEIRAEYAQKIAAAHAFATARRTAAFVDVPYDVAGVQLRAMTLHDYALLLSVKSPHLCEVTEPDAPVDRVVFWAAAHAQLMWPLSLGYEPNDTRARDRFIKRISAMDFAKLHSAVTEYLRDTFADAPRSSANPVSTQKTAPLSVSFIAYWVHQLASEFHWSRAECMALPLKEYFQYVNLIRQLKAANLGKVCVPLNDEVDRLWSEMMQRLDRL